MGQENNWKKAVLDMADSLRSVFKRYSRTSRKTAWETLSSPRGKHDVIDPLLLDPYRSLQALQKLNFKEWLEDNQNS